MMVDYVDKEGFPLSSESFYKVYPYTSPHIFNGLTSDGLMAKFANFQGEEDVLVPEKVAIHVRVYEPEELKDFLDSFLKSIDNSQDLQNTQEITRMGKSLCSFIRESGRHCKQR